MRALIRLLVLTLTFVPALAWGVDHKVEKTDDAPADGLSADIKAILAPGAIKVVRGTSRTVCEIWLRKETPATEDKLPTAVNYPFIPGQLMGVVRFPKKASDFRNQDIADGVYTLRYGQQPVDGAHVGTSVTRDFLLLLPANVDQNAGTLDYKTLTKHSSQAAGSNHPALLSVLKATEGGEGIRHDEEHDWWIVRLPVKLKGKELAMDVVIVGHAAE